MEYLLRALNLIFYPEGSAIELLKAFKDLLDERGVKTSTWLKGAIETDPTRQVYGKW